MATIPSQCLHCLRYNNIARQCNAFKTFYQTKCPSRTQDVKKYLKDLEQLMLVNKGTYTSYMEFKREYDRIKKQYELQLEKEIKECYNEDIHRGSGGGSSEGGGRENKQIMKDNKAQECKDYNKSIRKEYSEELKQWEEDNGELEKHKSIGYGMNRSKFDNYVGREIDKFGIVPTKEELEAAKQNLIEQGILHEGDL